MATGITAVISPQANRRIDQLTFPGLLATAAWMARWDRRAAAVTLATAGVEGVAYLTTDYPPAVLPMMSFRTHNPAATAHGALVIALGLMLPGLTRRGRVALCTLATMPITLAALSGARGREGGLRGGGEVAGPRERPASPFSSGR